MDKKYIVSYVLNLDMGDNIIQTKHGTMLSDHEITEEEIKNMEWNGKFMSVYLTSREVS